MELFEGTVAENICRFGALDSEAIVAAAKRAAAHDMILGLAEGYETRIGASGTALSGGQRQRIGLARALYGDPALLVLDEPNAAGRRMVLDYLVQPLRDSLFKAWRGE